jgi:hypothetical protein
MRLEGWGGPMFETRFFEAILTIGPREASAGGSRCSGSFGERLP